MSSDHVEQPAPGLTTGLRLAADPLGTKTQQGRPAIGLFANDPDTVELCGYIGFDFFMIDQMYSANDWSRTQSLIRAGEAAGITPVVRVQSNPWLGEDPRVAMDVARVLALGARYVLVSNRGRRDMEACVRAIYDWHRKIMVVHPFVGLSAAEAEQQMRKVAEQTFVIPQPEAKSALDEALETLAIPEVRMLFVATGDASRELSPTGEADWYAPKLWELIESLVTAAKKKGAVIGASTSSGTDFCELARRVERLHKFGVQMIMIQGAPYLFQIAVGQFVRELRALLQ